MVIDDVALGKVKKSIVLQECVLEVVGFDRRNIHIGSDAASAVHRAPAIGELHLAVGGVGSLGAIAVVIVVVKRNVAVVALNEASARRVVVRGGQRQPGVLRQRINGLHQ